MTITMNITLYHCLNHMADISERERESDKESKRQTQIERDKQRDRYTETDIPESKH